MKKVLNFGSINVDYVYTVDHFVRPGETINSNEFKRFAGGKGLNQSIALAQAGSHVYHAGKFGSSDHWLKTLMGEKGVDTTFVEPIEGSSGHAIIQVNGVGENAIIIVGGANQQISESDMQRIIQDFGSDDYLLVQNEVNDVSKIIKIAQAKGLKIVFNPAPMTTQVSNYPLGSVVLLILNENEAHGLTGEIEPNKIYATLSRKFPDTALLLTLGSRGASYYSKETQFFQPAEKIHVLDTTGAGDTFIGYFLAELINTDDPQAALAWATCAAAISVSRHGAADSIPSRKEVEEFQLARI